MITTVINAIVIFFNALGMFGAFLSMFIENIGIPLPTEIGYVIAQNLVNERLYTVFDAVLILTLGHLAGSLISYEIGKAGDNIVTNKVQENHKIQMVHNKLTNWYKKYGTLTVFLTRFVGYVRPWSSFVAGFADVPFWPFILWTTLGSLIFNILALYFSNIFIAIWRTYAQYHVLIILIATCLFFAYFIYLVIKYFFKAIKNS